MENFFQNVFSARNPHSVARSPHKMSSARAGPTLVNESNFVHTAGDDTRSDHVISSNTLHGRDVDN